MFERLTNPQHGGVRSIRFPRYESKALEWANRLAAYEDTGLTPDEIAALRAELDAMRERAEAAERDLNKMIDEADYPFCLSFCKNTALCRAGCTPEWRGPVAEKAGDPGAQVLPG